MDSLKDEKSIIIKGAEKGAVVIVWDHEDYIKEASKQLEDINVYLEVPNDSSALVSTIFNSLEKNKETWGFVTGHTQSFLSKRPQIYKVLLIT